ncbi:hypothetical protein [Paractinoplanes lichenicola]|uniref:Uncharacterized protein n=1 Tax=Paractinoplanes lichenicola TaxID=2802976 RepID=A0ABS1VW84_9ACTN|nr:hypothetical protein [Actinoplanes lichenicola]MBL7258714.1 hypothetical protein [Actinoplanes lichenicola]
MATYIRWFMPGHGHWCYDELDDSQWSQRHVEQRDRDDVFFAAASLAETLHARDTGGWRAVAAYEYTYGISPEAPLDFTPSDASELRITSLSAAGFERIWSEARAAREADWGVRPL